MLINAENNLRNSTLVDAIVIAFETVYSKKI